MDKYKIKIKPITNLGYCAVKPYEIELETDDIEWSMEQYQRNREPLEWEIIN
jgi:hypothetical protein|tara:strand:+ start:928 stop:1083 length:156 start_codon:yes stop_codon:yes gene_type:complete